METITKVHVGVDVSKANLDVYILPINKAFRVDNTPKGIKLLNKSLTKFDVQVVACESSGGYENLMLRMVAAKGHQVQHIDPRRIKGFIASEGVKTKTDAIDSKMIALFAQQKYRAGEQTKLTSEYQRHLQELCKRRGQLVKNITTEKNRLQHPDCFFSEKSIKNHIIFLETELKAIHNQIKILIKENNAWSEKAKLMMTVPGVGECTAIELLSKLPELGLLNDKQIAALAGLAPYSRESGNWKGKSFIRDGRPTLRTMLYMSALTAIKHNAPIKTFYNRLIASKKTPKVALIAAMRKLLIIINAMLKKGEAWNPA